MPPADGAGPARLELECLPGRFRSWCHFLALPLVAVTAWAWFGVTGTVPVVIWWWHVRPRLPAGSWQVDLARVRRARLGPWRTCIAFEGLPPLEIFNDEVPARDLARLRRTLKAQLASKN